MYIIRLKCVILMITIYSTSARNEMIPSQVESKEQHIMTRDTFNEDPAVTRFREYLRLDSSQPNPNYTSCIEWLKKQSNEIGLEYNQIDFPPPGLFIIRMTWKGSNSKLKSIMVNSHIDVVPADKTKWKYDPFGAIKDSNGNIYGRGTQDRKSLGVQYLETVRKLKAKGYKPLRTLHITFVPDEEVGGTRGMGTYINSMDFQKLNIGLELDEGSSTSDDTYVVHYAERSPWQYKVTAAGKSSHAGIMYESNAGVKLSKVINSFLKFRKKQIKILKKNSTLGPGDITSINLSQLGGGYQPNVVPSELWAIFDMRIKIDPKYTFDDVEKMINDICMKAGPGVRYEFIMKSKIVAQTIIDDRNIWWTTFKNIFKEKELKLFAKFPYGSSDARYIRNLGYSALGFCPLPKTESLAHQDNEYLNENTFLNGIELYEIIIPRLTSVDPSFG